MFKLRDRGEHEFALGPTAEEVLTDLAKGVVSSYRQLPMTIYQIQWKFRDETRPRFGLMRSKEFLMKDAYSFDVDAEGADRNYWIMYEAYKRIFSRCGLKAVPVQADGGDMGDSLTHEFHVLAEAGEDGIAWCEGCGYAANLEKAEKSSSPAAATGVKTLVYLADGTPVAVCVPGDREVNEVKLKHFLGAKACFPDAAQPVEPSFRNVADVTLKGSPLLGETTVAEADYADLAIVKDGDLCPHCSKPMVIKRGIEVGQVFKLGTKYSAAFKATFKNDKLEEKTMIMGCYGVGISRTLQAVIEQSHDKDGIIWPSSVAPYQVVIELLDPDDPEVAKVAEDLESALEKSGVDVIVDDRPERPGVKFKDADLIGFPVRVVVGAKGLKNGGVEVKRRSEDKSATRIVAPAAALETVTSLL